MAKRIYTQKELPIDQQIIRQEGIVYQNEMRVSQSEKELASVLRSQAEGRTSPFCNGNRRQITDADVARFEETVASHRAGLAIARDMLLTLRAAIQ